MGILDKLFGTGRSEPSTGQIPRRAAPGDSADEQAIERYRYLLRTAPPEALEQAHAEAFARLNPQQRAEVLRHFGETLPPSELSEARSGDPRALARAATRAEVRSPGFIERTLGPGGMGMGGGGFGFGSSLLASLAGSFIGTAIASQLMHGFGGPPLEQFASSDALADAREPDFTDVESGHGDVDAGDFDDGGGFDDA
jgi:hypothetical protein